MPGEKISSGRGQPTRSIGLNGRMLWAILFLAERLILWLPNKRGRPDPCTPTENSGLESESRAYEEMADAFSCYAIDEVARVSNDGPSAASLAILAIRQVNLCQGGTRKDKSQSLFS
jgi:hypothetical protein